MAKKQKTEPTKESLGKLVREWTGIAFGLVGTLLALAGFDRAGEADQRAIKADKRAIAAEQRALANQLRTEQILTEQLLAEAWDLLGGRPGTTILYSFSESPEDLELARRRIKEALARDPKNAKAHRYQAIYEEAVSDPQRALDSYLQSIRLDPTASSTHLNYGIALTELGRSEEALAAFKEASNLGGNRIVTLINVGVLLWDQGHKEQAAVAFAEATRLLEKKPIGLTPRDANKIREMMESDSYERIRETWRARGLRLRMRRSPGGP